MTMANYPSLPPRSHLEDLFRNHPKGVESLLQFHDVFLRGESAFTVAERELIAAFVSSVNACEFCFGAHRTMAIAFGVDEQVIESAIQDHDMELVDERMRPVLQYARKVTERAAVLPGDMRAFFDAGWDEAALHDALIITCLFNFMNRLVDGAGLVPKTSYERPTQVDLETRRDSSYLEWGIRAGFFACIVNKTGVNG